MIISVEKEYFNETFTSYKMTLSNNKIWSVPLDTENSDYQAIQEWIADGGTVIDNGGGE
jgi:hypothetical protein